jgi:asparagine synthase (glutamine-hydrolysing)
MRLGYVPGSQSIYEGILRLPPGTSVTFAAEHLAPHRLPQPQSYWQACALPRQQPATAAAIDDAQALDGLDAVLRQAVKGQMISDVPLGALLSGGIDSSLVVALMQAQSAQPVHTFSIGFEGSATDEAPHAHRVAQHLGTRHTELYVGAADALAVVPQLAEIFCEPFADSSQVPTLMVSRMARRQVTVALSGDGGDELFAGYDRYFRVLDGWRRVRSVPRSVRRAASLLIGHLPLGLLDAAVRAAGNPGRLRHPGDRVRKIARVLDSGSVAELNRGLLTLWDPAELMPGYREVDTVFSADLPAAPTDLERLMLADTLCYLPDDLLVKVDRAAMAVSLETRAPFLDHRVVEYAWSLPFDCKVRPGQGKWLLRRLLDRYVPRQLVERPKQGFGLPVDGWLQGPLRDWAESLLSVDALSRHGLFNVALVRRRWAEQLGGRRNWQQHLWSVLMFQAWSERYR